MLNSSSLTRLPKVTVLMPMYNAEKYVRKAIESILEQSYQDFEFIIINDASTDKSLEIAIEYANSDNRIIIINCKVNQGIANVLNEGLKLSKGDYIVRMDADDISKHDRIERQVKFMEGNLSCDISGSWLETFNDQDSQSELWKVPSDHNSIKLELLFNTGFFHPTVIFRKSAIEDLELYNSDYVPAEDYELWSRFMLTKKMANIPEPLLYYRVHEESISKSARTKQVLQANRVRKNILDGMGIWVSTEEWKIHCAISDGDKVYILENKDKCNIWFNKLMSTALTSQFSSETAVKNMISAYELKLDKIDSSYITFIVRKYIPFARSFDRFVLLSFIRKAVSILPKRLIQRAL